MREQNERAIELFGECFELDAPGRARFLDAACGDDGGLRDAVKKLLRHHDKPAVALALFEASARSRRPDAGAPERIGPYRILGVLGRGGMGVVYRAEQQQPRRPVALKVLQPGLVRDDTLKRFEQESQMLGLLQHPGIAAVYDAGTCDFGYGEMPYFAMELVDGEPLTDFAGARNLDVRGRCALLATICDAVQHAHERGVIHRDLKPGNVLVSRSSTATGEWQPKILDFGIARSTDPELQLSTMQTRTGQLLGTLPYMSPEQLSGTRAAIDGRSDVYALGVLLYELLAGRLPLQLEGRSLSDVARIVRDEDATLLGRIDRNLRGDVETICDKALCKEREGRYGSVAELAEDLRRFCRNEPITARPQTTWYQLKKFASRNRGLVGGVAATMLALAVGLALTVFYATRASRLAESSQRLAKSESDARKAADEASESYRRALYRSEMRRAGDALGSPSGLAQIQHILPSWEPKGAEPDLRDWEWHLLDSHARAGRGIRVPGRLYVAPLYWDSADDLIVHAPRKTEKGIDWQIGVLDLEAGVIRRVIVETDIVIHERSPDRQQIAVRTPHSVRICRYPGGEQETVWHFEHGPVGCSWSPDSAYLAILLCDQERPTAPDATHVVVRRVDTGVDVAKLHVRFYHACRMIAFSPDGRLLAVDAGLEPGAGVVLFRTSDWQRERVLGGSVQATVCRWHPTRSHLAIGYRDGGIRIFDAARGDRVRSWAGHRQMVAAMSWRPDGRALATGGQNGTVRLWDVGSGDGRLLGSHSQSVRRLCWRWDGERLASGGRKLRIWDHDEPRAIRTLVEPHGRNLACSPLAWHPDGKRLAVGVSGRTKILDVRSGTVLEEIAGSSLSFDCGGRRIAFRRGRKVIVRTTDAAQAIFEFELDNGAGGCIAWQPGGDLLAVPGHGRAGIWRPGGDPRMSSSGTPRFLAWSPRDGSLWLGSWSGTLSRRDPERGEFVQKLAPSACESISWDPTEGRLALGLQDRTVVIGDPDQWDRHQVLRGHADRLLAVAWHPNGRRLASGSRDRTVRIWDVASGTEVLVLEHDEDVQSVAWSPDGSALASLSEDGCVKIWQVFADR